MLHHPLTKMKEELSLTAKQIYKSKYNFYTKTNLTYPNITQLNNILFRFTKLYVRQKNV